MGHKDLQTEERKKKSMLKQDLNFLQIVSMVTSRLGCTIDSIDVEARTVSVTCPGGKEQETDCAIAIGEIIEGTLDPGDPWVFPKITSNPVLRDGK
jgi:hypothetical protein